MSNQNKIILLGGGGHAGVLIELIRMCQQYNISGILDPRLKVNVKILGVPILGGDNLLTELYNKGIKNICIGIGSIKDNIKRKELYLKVKQLGFTLPLLIHQSAIISETSQLSEGVQIMARAIVQTNSLIGANTIINTGAIIEHNCNVGNHVHVCPGAIVSGGCTIKDGAFIGTGATIIQEIKIGKNAIIAAGAVVVNDVAEGVMVKGVPAKVVS